MRYRFYSQLFNELPRLLGTSQNAISRKMGMTRGSLHHSRETGDCMLRNLTKVCNAYHIDIMKFFVTDDDPALPENLVTEEEEWRDFDYRSERIRLLWHGDKKLTRKDFATALGIKELKATVNRLTAENSPIRASQWAHIISTFDIDPYQLWLRADDTCEEDADLSPTTLLQRIKALEEEVRMLKERL